MHKFLALKKKQRILKKPLPGDVLRMDLIDGTYLFARVINPDTIIGNIEEVRLIYVYRDKHRAPDPPKELSPKRLLLPPLGVDRTPWTIGMVKKVENRPLGKKELLPVHCFHDDGTIGDPYRDEYGNIVKKPPPGDWGLFVMDNIYTLDFAIAKALGFDLSEAEN